MPFVSLEQHNSFWVWKQVSSSFFFFFFWKEYINLQAMLCNGLPPINIAPLRNASFSPLALFSLFPLFVQPCIHLWTLFPLQLRWRFSDHSIPFQNWKPTAQIMWVSRLWFDLPLHRSTTSPSSFFRGFHCSVHRLREPRNFGQWSKQMSSPKDSVSRAFWVAVSWHK